MGKNNFKINPMQIDRKSFIVKSVQAGLLGLLAFVAYFLGNRVVATKDCSTCPGNGICRGRIDCSKY